MPPRPDIAADARIVIASAAVSTSIPGETVILDPVTDQYFSLEGVGPRVWDLLQEPTTIAAIVRTLTDEYDVDAATCQSDLKEVLADLAAHGLLSVDDQTR